MVRGLPSGPITYLARGRCGSVMNTLTQLTTRRRDYGAPLKIWLSRGGKLGKSRKFGPNWFAAEGHARFTLLWRGRVGSEHVASCRGGVNQLHPHPSRVYRRSPTSPLQGEVGAWIAHARSRPIIKRWSPVWSGSVGEGPDRSPDRAFHLDPWRRCCVRVNGNSQEGPGH